MAETLTARYSWKKPEPGASPNTWGSTLNGDLDKIDAQVWSLNTQVALTGFNLSRGADGGAYGAVTFYNYNDGVHLGTLPRWQLYETSETESGGNAGSNFGLAAFDDSGASLGAVFNVSRATQAVTFNHAVAISGALNVSSFNATSITANTILGNSISSNGNIAAAGNIAATGGISATGAISGANISSVGTLTASGISSSGPVSSTTYMTAKSNFYLQQISGDCTYVVNDSTAAFRGSFGYRASDGAVGTFTNYGGGALYIDVAGNFFYAGGNSNAWKVNAGAWLGYSDARIKNVTGDYAKGLNEVLQLRPVTYTYKGNDALSEGAPSLHAAVAEEGREFVGLVAQEIETAFPDMVSKVSGFIDGKPVADLRGFDPSNLVFALINAVKELKAEIEELKARLP